MKGDSGRMQKGTCKGTMPLMLKSKMAASRRLATISDFNIPRNLNRIQNILLSVLEEEVSFIGIHKIISKVKSSVAKVSSNNSSEFLILTNLAVSLVYKCESLFLFFFLSFLFYLFFTTIDI